MPNQSGALLFVAVLLFSLVASVSACARGPVTPAPTNTPSPEPNDPFTINARLGRGVNLGNALEAPSEGAWGVVLKEEYFQKIKEGGFTGVRIPIRWSTHAAKEAPYTIKPDFIARIDWAVKQSLDRGLVVVINVHHYEEMAKEPEKHRERFLALWQQIAEHYKDYPPELIFEPMNEPNGALNSTLWNDIVAEAISTIRKSNPERTLIVGPVEWNNINALSSLKLPEEDRHIIATVHYYNPFQFTHQGAEWASGSQKWLGTTWTGTEAEKLAVDRDLDKAAAWGKANNRPIYVGEFGAYNKADMDSRATWTAYIARQAEARGMSWAYWEFCSGFGVYDSALRRWNEPLLKALIPQE